MKRSHPGREAIVEVGIAYIDEISKYVTNDMRISLMQVLDQYLSNEITYEEAQNVFFSLIGRCEPLDRIKEILSVPEEPLPTTDEPISEENPGNSRRRTRPWVEQEDLRLLAGIYRYGTENWTSISLFVGNGRTRAQCCQRWTRGLNPRISKEVWSYNEDAKLLRLVHMYGDKSWTRIASMMGNRSDVQCRYHFQQIRRDYPNIADQRIQQNPMRFYPSSITTSQPRMNFISDLNVEPTLSTSSSQPLFTVGDGIGANTAGQPMPLCRPPSLPRLPLVRMNHPPPPVPQPISRRPRSNSDSSSLDRFLKSFE